MVADGLDRECAARARHAFRRGRSTRRSPASATTCAGLLTPNSDPTSSRPGRHRAPAEQSVVTPGATVLSPQPAYFQVNAKTGRWGCQDRDSPPARPTPPVRARLVERDEVLLSGGRATGVNVEAVTTTACRWRCALRLEPRDDSAGRRGRAQMSGCSALKLRNGRVSMSSRESRRSFFHGCRARRRASKDLRRL